MRKETVEYNGVTAVVRSENRRTAILEAQYMQDLRTAYPQIFEYEAALAEVAVPSMQAGPVDALPPEQRKLWDAYMVEHTKVGEKYAAGRAYQIAAENVSFCLSRCETLNGIPFKFDPRGETDTVAAMEYYLEGDSDDELWKLIAAAFRRIQKPLTLVHQQPASEVSQKDREDPLSNDSTASGMTK